MQWFSQNWGLLVTILTTIVSLILYVIESIKKKNSKAISDLLGKIPTLVQQAESVFGAGHGADKMQWVLTQLRLLAIESHAKITQEELKNEVENVVQATKNVNATKVETTEQTAVVEQKIEN